MSAQARSIVVEPDEHALKVVEARPDQRDAGGNTVTTSTASVTVSITAPAGAALTCTANPKSAVAGVVTYAGCKIDKPGTYTLTATSGSLTAAVGSSFPITPGPATKLAFTTSPSGSTGGIAFPTQPVVTVQDTAGNTSTANSSVTLALTSAGGAALTCTSNPRTAVSGLDTFAGCTVDKPGTYTLTATSTGLTAAVSANFTITVGPASKLAFTTSPSGSTGGVAFLTQPVVTVRDAGNNTVTTSTDPVTLTITTPAGATLTCAANPKSAVAGVSTFATCKIDRPGTYTLLASSGATTTATSNGFTITTGVAAKVTFTTSPSGAVAGNVFATQPVVAVQDAGNNTVTTSTASITLTLTTPAGAALTCTANPKTAVAGVDTFTGCRINMTGTYTLTATSGSLTTGASTTFTITP